MADKEPYAVKKAYDVDTLMKKYWEPVHLLRFFEETKDVQISIVKRTCPLSSLPGLKSFCPCNQAKICPLGLHCLKVDCDKLHISLSCTGKLKTSDRLACKLCVGEADHSFARDRYLYDAIKGHFEEYLHGEGDDFKKFFLSLTKN